MSPLDPKQPDSQAGTTAATSQASQQPVVKFAKEPSGESVLPTLFGAGYGNYQTRPENFALSVITHTAIIALFVYLFHMTVQPQILRPSTNQTVQLSDYLATVGKGGPSGGGGGDASKLHASAGTPPRSAKQQFTPPVVLQQQQSKLMVEPTVVANLNIQSSQIGDPLSKLVAPSNGSGVGGGVGSGHGGPGVGSGIFHLGDSGVSAPRPIYSPEPEFSEEARKAKYQGVVGLNVVVGPDGRIHSAQVAKSLGMGLDEKAIETVRLWKFDPAKKDGRPVAVAVYIEVDFHLY